jgi:hypothetical protein
MLRRGARCLRVSPSNRAACFALITLVLVCAAAVVHADRLPSSPINSVFHIAKSENKNQVHYAVSVDARCRPSGKTPVHGYWREYEEGPNVTDALRSHQQRAYGLSARGVSLGEDRGDIRVSLRALPERQLRIETFRDGDRCRARAFTPIQGQPAVLTSIYVEIGFLYSIDYILLRGRRVSDGAPIQERIED